MMGQIRAASSATKIACASDSSTATSMMSAPSDAGRVAGVAAVVD